MIKKFISEFIGTLLLVFFGCGAAVALNQYVGSIYTGSLVFNLVAIALAFGLALVAIIAIFGNISGAHVNPAVSIACLIDGRMSIGECCYYIGAQLLGGVAGAGILSLIFGSAESLGANLFETSSALGAMVTTNVAFTVELILTFVFVLVVLSVTKKENNCSGVIIGLTLTLVHIFGLPFTGTSVNPARSLGPALLTGGVAMEQLWLFILAPMVGGVLAGLLYRFVLNRNEKELAYVDEVEEEMYDDDEEEKIEEEPKVEKVVEEKPKRQQLQKKQHQKLQQKKQQLKHQKNSTC